jgi:hypothetical protein
MYNGFDKAKQFICARYALGEAGIEPAGGQTLIKRVIPCPPRPRGYAVQGKATAFIQLTGIINNWYKNNWHRKARRSGLLLQGFNENLYGNVNPY